MLLALLIQIFQGEVSVLLQNRWKLKSIEIKVEIKPNNFTKCKLQHEVLKLLNKADIFVTS